MKKSLGYAHGYIIEIKHFFNRVLNEASKFHFFYVITSTNRFEDSLRVQNSVKTFLACFNLRSVILLNRANP